VAALSGAVTSATCAPDACVGKWEIMASSGHDGSLSMTIEKRSTTMVANIGSIAYEVVDSWGRDAQTTWRIRPSAAVEAGIDEYDVNLVMCDGRPDAIFMQTLSGVVAFKRVFQYGVASGFNDLMS